MVIDECIPDVGEGKPTQRRDSIVRGGRTAADVTEQLADVGLVHGEHATGVAAEF